MAEFKKINWNLLKQRAQLEHGKKWKWNRFVAAILKYEEKQINKVRSIVKLFK